jgi:hypothetical protein
MSDLQGRAHRLSRSAAIALVLGAWLHASDAAAESKFLGRRGGSPYAADSTANRHGRHGSRFSASSISNPHERYGSPFSAQSPNNPYTTKSPVLIGE